MFKTKAKNALKSKDAAKNGALILAAKPLGEEAVPATVFSSAH
jgi:hypothetical protein